MPFLMCYNLADSENLVMLTFFFFLICGYPVATAMSATTQNGEQPIFGTCGVGHFNKKATQYTCCSSQSDFKHL